jgi:UDP-glucose 4-epimerase
MTSVTITGAGGFLGQHLNSYLKTTGISVAPVSRLSLPGMFQVKDYTQTPGDQILLHLAEESDRGKVNNLGESYLESSVHGVEVLSKRFQKIIYMSSNVVYADENDGLCAIDFPVVGSDIYSRLKIGNERTVLDSGGLCGASCKSFWSWDVHQQCYVGYYCPDTRGRTFAS